LARQGRCRSRSRRRCIGRPGGRLQWKRPAARPRRGSTAGPQHEATVSRRRLGIVRHNGCGSQRRDHGIFAGGAALSKKIRLAKRASPRGSEPRAWQWRGAAPAPGGWRGVRATWTRLFGVPRSYHRHAGPSTKKPPPALARHRGLAFAPTVAQPASAGGALAWCWTASASISRATRATMAVVLVVPFLRGSGGGRAKRRMTECVWCNF